MDLLYYKNDIIENRLISVEIRKGPQDSPIHAHDFLEIIYITRGRAIHEHKDKRMPIAVGNFFFIDYGTKHRIVEKSMDFEAITCTFVPEYIDKSLLRSVGILDVLRHDSINLSPHSRIEFYFFQDDNGSILQLLRSMIDEYQNKEAGYLSFLRSSLIQLLVLTMRKLGAVSQNFDARVTAIMDYIDNHYGEKIYLDILCRDFYCSLSNISILFKAQTGITYTQYLRRVRMRASSKLLIQSSKSVEEIASEVGYTDARSFRRHFKEIYGLSPLGFRKAYN